MMVNRQRGQRGRSPETTARGLGAMLIAIGTLHFAVPKPFDSIIPAEIPGDPRPLTYASGAAEIGIGTGLLFGRTRRAAAALAVALFVAVFPANLNMVRLWWHKPLAYKLIALARLPLQLPMIAVAIDIFRNSGKTASRR